jgi:hypothetical protein
MLVDHDTSAGIIHWNCSVKSTVSSMPQPFFVCGVIIFPAVFQSEYHKAVVSE